ncbi:hypothetical protein ACPDHL_02155 [Myroides sp. C15-4]|uniref:hypothetical protein n=1 Tax=Myroides sp. C15-4 TaxID=3400532 RepID=UPI003D2F9AEB
MRLGAVFIVFAALLLSSCSLDLVWLNVENNLRNKKMKGKVLDQPIGVKVVFDPTIVATIDTIGWKQGNLLFLKGVNLDSLSQFFHVEKQLEFYLAKRNVYFEAEADYVLTVDKLLFNELISYETVESNTSTDVIGSAVKNSFYFGLEGTVYDSKLNSTKDIKVLMQRETYPSESLLIKGLISTAGYVETQAVVNTILHVISYDVYVVINDFEKKRKEIEQK